MIFPLKYPWASDPELNRVRCATLDGSADLLLDACTPNHFPRYPTSFKFFHNLAAGTYSVILVRSGFLWPPNRCGKANIPQSKNGLAFSSNDGRQ